LVRNGKGKLCNFHWKERETLQRKGREVCVCGEEMKEQEGKESVAPKGGKNPEKGGIAGTDTN